jgi:broad specificity phosphatase PhoE
MTNRIYLVRQGENRANLTLEFSSRKVDYSLTEKGILQARQTAEYFRDKQIDAIYASPLKRARETAEIIGEACGLRPVVTENLRELQVGDLEGLPPSRELWAIHDWIVNSWLDSQPERKFPHGDDYFSLWARMKAGVLEACAGRSGQQIVMVGHGGIFTTTLKDLCPGVKFHDILKSIVGNCSISVVDVDIVDEQPRGKLVSWGTCEHLSGEAANMVLGLPVDGTFFPGETSE